MVVAKADGDRMVLLLPWMDTAATDRRYLVMTLHGSNDDDDDDDGDVVKDGRSYMEISLVRTRDVHSSRGHISYGSTVTVTIGKVVLVSWWWSLRRSRESVSFIGCLLAVPGHWHHWISLSCLDETQQCISPSPTHIPHTRNTFLGYNVTCDDVDVGRCTLYRCIRNRNISSAWWRYQSKRNEENVRIESIINKQ